MTGATRTKKYLFICAQGINRSPTAVRVANSLAKKAGIWAATGHRHLKGGIFNDELEDLGIKGREYFATRLNHYDKLFVMDEDMMYRLTERYKIDRGKIVILDIPDKYVVDSPALVGILEEKLKEWIK